MNTERVIAQRFRVIRFGYAAWSFKRQTHNARPVVLVVNTLRRTTPTLRVPRHTQSLLEKYDGGH